MATRKAVAAALGMAPASLRDARLKASWFPHEAVQSDGRGRASDWDLPRIVAAYRDHETHRGELNDIRARCLMTKVKLLRLKVDDLRTKNEVAEANVLPREEWEEFKRAAPRMLRQACEGLPAKLRALVECPRLGERIEAESRRLLRAIIEGFERTLEEGPYFERD